jgi:hypothetical protein
MLHLQHHLPLQLLSRMASSIPLTPPIGIDASLPAHNWKGHVSHAIADRGDDEPLHSPAVAIADTDLRAVPYGHLAQKDRVAGTSSHPLVFAAVVAVSLLLPGIAHLRLGAALSGLAFLLVTAVLSAIQFAAPIIEPTARAALLSSIAFALGWLVSLAAARSAARLLRT